MNEPDFTVFIVDDDAGVLKALSRLLRSKGYRAQPYSSPRQFLDQHDASIPGCVVIDLLMPDVDGLELQAKLTASGTERPIIFLTGEGDIRSSVRAIKGGALDFLTKPVDAPELLAAIERAGEHENKARRVRQELAAIESRLAMLTPREFEVLGHVVAGRLNKQIANDLGTVEKTIKVHRSRMMAKLGLRTVADLVRLAERAGIRPVGVC